MNEPLERQLRAAFAERLVTISPTQGVRLRALDYRPRQRVLLTRPVLGASGAAVLAALALVLFLVSSSPSTAFAGWTTSPAVVPAQTLTRTLSACKTERAARVLASEQRGPFTAIVFMRSASPELCITQSSRVLVRQSTVYPPRLLVKPAADKVNEPFITHTVVGSAHARLSTLYRREDKLFARARSHGKISIAVANKIASSPADQKLKRAETKLILGPGAITALSGSVGRDVTALTFVLKDGTRVRATVGNGWYLAWWPGSSRVGAKMPIAARLTIKHGATRTAVPAALLAADYKPCLVEEPCRDIAVHVQAVRGVATSLTNHFGLFRTPPRTSRRELAADLRATGLFSGGPAAGVLGNFGVDQRQAVEVSNGPRGVLLVIPGTEGLCVLIVGGGGGCTNIVAVLQHGEIELFGSGPSTLAFGVVPDGNKYVTINLPGRHTVRVRVHDNTFISKPYATIRSVTLRNAYGRKVTHS